MEKSELKRQVKEIQELTKKIEEAIPDGTDNGTVLDTLCFLIGNIWTAYRKLGLDNDTYISIVNKKLKGAIMAFEE